VLPAILYFVIRSKGLYAGKPRSPTINSFQTQSVVVRNFPTEAQRLVCTAGLDLQGFAVPRGSNNLLDGLIPVYVADPKSQHFELSAEWEWTSGIPDDGGTWESLGGGDVSVSARGDMANLSVAVADSYLANANGPSTHFLEAWPRMS